MPSPQSENLSENLLQLMKFELFEIAKLELVQLPVKLDLFHFPVSLELFPLPVEFELFLPWCQLP